MSAGGTLVTIGDATRWATGGSVGLLATTAEWKGGAPIRDDAGPAVRPSASGAPAQLGAEPLGQSLCSEVRSCG